MEKEIWKDIPGWEGYYQASNLGRIRSLDRYEEFMNNNGKISTRLRKGRVMKQTIVQNGYCVVTLCGKRKYVHRIIAETFIPNPDNLPYINHKSEIKTENSAENLEWCDPKYNVNYGSGKEKNSKKQKNSPMKSLVVEQYTIDGKLVKVWPSLHEIRRVLNKSISYVQACCRNKAHTAYGFVWKYKEKEAV